MDSASCALDKTHEKLIMKARQQMNNKADNKSILEAKKYKFK